MPDVEASFHIDQPANRVWDFFQDVPEVVTCMPGTELLDQTGAATYKGKVTVKLGPVTAAFEGEASIVETDTDTRMARIDAAGVDRRGNNRAKASVTYEVNEDAGGSRVRIHGSIKLTGALAQMGRGGIIQDVANLLTVQFSERLHDKLARSDPEADAAADAQAPPLAIEGARLTRFIIFARIKRLLTSLFGRAS